MTRFLVVPQWQGSSSARAMQLVDGAQAIAGDLPRAASTVLEPYPHAGEALDSGVARLSALQHIAQAHLQALAEHSGPVITVGGDGGVATTAALAALGAAGSGGDRDAVVLWLSAHPDLHDAATSPTGGFDTMAARALFEDALARPAGRVIHSDRIILAGVRAVEPAEQAVIDEHAITVVGADRFDADAVAAAVAERTPSSVFVHVDLDVLDPAAITGVATPEPFGPDVAGVVAALAAVRETVPLCAAAITGFAPASPAAAVDDLGAILRLVGALA